MSLSLKSKSSLFVAFGGVLLLGTYFFLSTQYIRQQKDRLVSERNAEAIAVAGEVDDFLDLAGNRLRQIAALPELLHDLQNIQSESERLHYIFFQSDLFTNGVCLVDAKGLILWSSDPTQLGKPFPDYSAISQALIDARERKYALTMSGEGAEHQQILVASPVLGGANNIVGALIGAIPPDHPAIVNALMSQAGHDGIAAQLADAGGLVISSTDSSRVLRQAKTTFSNNALLAFSEMKNAPWTVTIDQDQDTALAEAYHLRFLLMAFGIVVIAGTTTILFFVVRSFTKPIELLTADARLLAAGDLNVRFTSGRRDEIGTLGIALNDMNSQVRASYEHLLISEKASLMGQVVAGIAHELNNPLTIVVGHTQLLLEEEVDERLKQSLNRIHDGAERASRIVRNLLTFARQQKPDRKAVDVNAVILKTVELRAYELRASNIELITELSPVPLTMADPYQLQQVFLNLMVNAEQAMHEAHGRGRLLIKSFKWDNHVEIVFEDDGPGIPEDSLRRIFDPFFTTKGVGKGTGLGLSICQGIVAEHGGRLTASGVPESGARFTVELPLVAQPATPTLVESHVERAPTRKNVLIMDDKGRLRDLFFELMARDGHRVQTAASDTEALDLVRREYFDLLIIDTEMAGAGMELYRILKRDGSDLADRLLFITGDITSPDTLQFLESTGNPWIAKPLEVAPLRDAVNAALIDRRP